MAASLRAIERTDWSEPGIPTPAGASEILRFLGTVRQGHLFVDASGRVVACTPPARRLLEAYDPGFDLQHSIRWFIRALAAGSAQTVSAVLLRFREARLTSSACRFEIVLGKQVVQIETHAVQDGGWAATLEDISARRAAETDAAKMARLDPLTKLPNRLLLREHLDEALDRLHRAGEGCALLLIDLDRFKPVNDTLGHPVGDALLEKVADRLRSTVRSIDTVARIGGDEFVVLQTATLGGPETQALAHRIVDLVSRTYVLEGHLLSIGASIGIALAPSDGTTADKLLKCADLALYRAKVDGRGTFRFFESKMDAQMQARRSLELDMRQALARREFQLHFQPQLNLEDNRLVGCEALIRWHHPERGHISPAEFIPLAEELGLIVPIGEWVVRQACREAASWPIPLSVAVNVSPAQFKSDRLVEMIMSALAFSGLPAERLEIEITEGVLLKDNDRTLATLHRLRGLGIRVSMDDFGTGYSSLSYLRSFPFDKIKIDRSFVKDMTTKPDGDAVIRAISGLGRSLGMTTVAEGVETPEQMKRIRAQGCTDVQGYFISKPLPSGDLINWLAGFTGPASSN